MKFKKGDSVSLRAIVLPDGTHHSTAVGTVVSNSNSGGNYWVEVKGYRLHLSEYFSGMKICKNSTILDIIRNL